MKVVPTSGSPPETGLFSEGGVNTTLVVSDCAIIVRTLTNAHMRGGLGPEAATVKLRGPRIVAKGVTSSLTTGPTAFLSLRGCRGNGLRHNDLHTAA